MVRPARLGGISIWLVPLWAQLPVRYGIRADLASFIWREQRFWGEYRLFQWAPPFIATVERARWEGLTAIIGLSYFRRLPWRGAVARMGLRYYFLRPAYSPHGVWAGILGGIGVWGARSEKPLLAPLAGLAVGYQHIFYQGYGATVEPFLLLEPRWRKGAPFAPLQLGLGVGFGSRRWDRRMTR